MIGVTIGCFLGMIPLLFFREKKDGKNAGKKEEECKEASKQQNKS